MVKFRYYWIVFCSHDIYSMKHLSADLQFPVFLAGLRLFLQPLPKQLIIFHTCTCTLKIDLLTKLSFFESILLKNVPDLFGILNL